MRLGYIVAVILLILAGGIFFYFFSYQNKENNKKNESDNPYIGLRDQVFNISPETANIRVENENEPYVMIMEIGYPEAVATLVSLSDGNASLYFSNGGGIIGGFAHENVRKASIDFVNQSNRYLNLMNKTDSYLLPEKGMVRFYVVTNSGIYYHEESENKLQEYKSEFTDLYAYGQNVLTELRHITDK